MKRSIILQTILIIFICILLNATNSMGTEMPSPQEPVIASSVLPPSNVANYLPGNVLDGNQSTAWVEGVEGDGIGEWIAIYLGESDELSNLSDIVVQIEVGYQKSEESFINNGCPSKLLVELFSGEKLLSKNSVDATIYASAGVGWVYTELQVSSNVQGSIWLRITIEDAIPGKKWHDTCISEIVPDLKDVNPYEAREAAKLFCRAIRNKDKSTLLKFTSKSTNKVIGDFVDEFNPSITCDADILTIFSSNIFELYAFHDPMRGRGYARFEREGNSWRYKGIIQRRGEMQGL